MIRKFLFMIAMIFGNLTQMMLLVEDLQKGEKQKPRLDMILKLTLKKNILKPQKK